MSEAIRKGISAYKSALDVKDSSRKSRIIEALDNLDRLGKVYFSLVFEEISSARSSLYVDLPWQDSSGDSYMKLERYKVTIIPKVDENPPKRRLPNFIESAEAFISFLDLMNFGPENLNVDRLQLALSKAELSGYGRNIDEAKLTGN
jgi:hypothetical protein